MKWTLNIFIGLFSLTSVAIGLGVLWNWKPFVPPSWQPCSQAVSPLPPFVDPGCSWSHHHLWHKPFHWGRVDELIIFVDLTEAKKREAIAGCYIKPHTGEYTIEILQSYCMLHTGQDKWNILVCTQRIEVWFQFQPFKLLRSKVFCLNYVVRYITQCFFNVIFCKISFLTMSRNHF